MGPVGFGGVRNRANRLYVVPRGNTPVGHPRVEGCAGKTSPYTGLVASPGSLGGDVITRFLDTFTTEIDRDAPVLMSAS